MCSLFFRVRSHQEYINGSSVGIVVLEMDGSLTPTEHNHNHIGKINELEHATVPYVYGIDRMNVWYQLEKNGLMANWQ